MFPRDPIRRRPRIPDVEMAEAHKTGLRSWAIDQCGEHTRFWEPGTDNEKDRSEPRRRANGIDRPVSAK